MAYSRLAENGGFILCYQIVFRCYIAFRIPLYVDIGAYLARYLPSSSDTTYRRCTCVVLALYLVPQLSSLPSNAHVRNDYWHRCDV